MEISWRKRRLLLKETFSISYGNYSHRDALLVQLSHAGFHGYGECVAIDYYQINLDEFIKKLKEIQYLINEQTLIHPKEFFLFLSSLQLHHFLLSAIDCAYWDLYGKLENLTFSQLNEFSASRMPESSITISIATTDEQLKKIEHSDWKKFKVKANGLDKENIFRLLETGKKISLDSNASFHKQDCLWLQENELSRRFLYFEQPMKIGNYKVLNKNLNANWMCDEDCQDVSDLEKLSLHYKSVNIKLMKCGGLTPALEMIKTARNIGYNIMIGCMTESSVGISAGIAIASLCDFADLDGANLIANDDAKGSFVEKGRMFLSEKPGLGIEMI